MHTQVHEHIYIQAHMCKRTSTQAHEQKAHEQEQEHEQTRLQKVVRL